VPIIESAVAAIEPLIAERTLQFQADIGEDAFVMADPIRLQQAIGNVLTNACRYTPPGGQVTISLAVGSTVTITVRDNGIGIRAADMERLFEPFERGSQSTGLGLGLFLARAFVQYSGGTLHASSAGEGSGSTFVIRLPAMRHDACEAPAPGRPQWQAAFDADPEGPRREAQG
jgi:signal transduction histidine kinase